MALFPAQYVKDDEIITVSYSNKNAITMSSGQVVGIVEANLTRTLPAGVSDLSNYVMLGMSDWGYVSSDRIFIICANATTPYIGIVNDTGGSFTVLQGYVRMNVRYMKKKTS